MFLVDEQIDIFERGVRILWLQVATRGPPQYKPHFCQKKDVHDSYSPRIRHVYLRIRAYTGHFKHFLF